MLDKAVNFHVPTVAERIASYLASNDYDVPDQLLEYDGWVYLPKSCDGGLTRPRYTHFIAHLGLKELREIRFSTTELITPSEFEFLGRAGFPEEPNLYGIKGFRWDGRIIADCLAGVFPDV